jgi:succinoglycan biosynthesis protein ExoO
VSISVVIPAYNAETTIERAIRTVLDQTLPPHEVIVVDDASSDGTREVVRRMAEGDPRIRLITSPQNAGPSRARNVGFRAAEGEWLAIQDADDAWTPERLEMMMAAAVEHDADLVGDNMLLHDIGTDQITRTGFPVERGLRWIRPIDLFEQDVQLGAEFGYGLLQPLMRKSFLQDRSLAYTEAVRYGEDMVFLAEILFSGARAVVISNPGYIYTTRVGEQSGKKSPHSKSIPRFDLIADRIDALKGPYAAAITPEIDQAMTRLSDRYRIVHGLNLARQQRHERGLLTYALYLFRRPHLLSHMVGQRLGRVKRVLWSFG